MRSVPKPASHPVDGRDRLLRWALFAGACVLMAALGNALLDSRSEEQAAAELAEALPRQRNDEYVSSNQCRSCHPAEHASWHQTFHRTMTQAAAPGTVVGRFDGSTVMSDGLEYRVFRKGDEFWAEMPDPEEVMYVVQGGKPTPLEEIPRVERRVLMTTGSHHYQTYWVEGSDEYGNLFQTLPLIYLIGDDRWIPREDAFMIPPDRNERMITQWNHHCINCHSTGGNPGVQVDTPQGAFATEVGELGISCEACHGPGEEHIRLNRNPARRYTLHHDDEARDPSIVNPERLDHRRSSQICGQCHGVFIRDEQYGMKFATEGIQFRPGEDINDKRYYIAHPTETSSPGHWAEFRRNPDFYRERWWPDGTVLAGGREYTALSASGCYTRGEISCLSCHSMHDSDPVDQLNAVGHSRQACIQCHDQPQFTTNVGEHTHHAPGSSGSECMNCHMPHTAYALFSAIRNHQISSPDIRASARQGVPNACNLCHLDRTLAWTSEQMDRFYDTGPVSLTEEQQETSAALLWLLKGDAAQRVITAWHLGWNPAREASGSDWLAPFQAQLLDDPYGVVRYVAGHALLQLVGFEDFSYDFAAPPALRREAVHRAVERWRQRPPSQHAGEPILLDADGRLQEERLRSLLSERNNRPVRIKE